MAAALLRRFITVKIGMVFLLSSFAHGQVIQNDVFWKDTEGNPILSNGGGTLKVGDTWYWYGAKYGNAATYYNKNTGSEGDVFNAPGGWFGRLGVVYHAGTKKYVHAPPGVANGGTGWNASRAYYISATNIKGPYGAEKIMATSDVDYCHGTQTGFFTTVYGTEDTTVIFCGDRCIDAVKGTWKVLPGNNYILNALIEADRMTTNPIRAWSGSGARNEAGSHAAGNFCMSLGSGTSATQTIASCSRSWFPVPGPGDSACLCRGSRPAITCSA